MCSKENGDCIIRSEQKIERYTVQEVADLIDDGDIEAEAETEIDESDSVVEEDPSFPLPRSSLEGDEDQASPPTMLPLYTTRQSTNVKQTITRRQTGSP